MFLGIKGNSVRARRLKQPDSEKLLLLIRTATEGCQKQSKSWASVAVRYVSQNENHCDLRPFFVFQIISRISLEVTLGLLSALNGDVYKTCQYWLQALSHCNKHCLFALQRQLCCMLLPHGAGSLEQLLSLSRELRSVNAADEPKTGESMAQLFLHFQAFYCKALMIEIWYRCPDVLRIFQHHQDVSVEVEVECEREETGSESSEKLKVSAEDMSTESKPSKFGNASAISDYSQIISNDKVDENGEFGVDLATADGEDSKRKVDPKEPFSSTKRSLVGEQDLKSTLKSIKAVLLSDHHVKINNLRELLTEIRKALLLKRSEQFFQMNSTSSKLNQKKKKVKAQPAHMAQPLGFSPSSSEGEPTSETASRSSLVEPAECTQTEPREDNTAVAAERSESLVEVVELDTRGAVLVKDNSEEGEQKKQSEGGNECATFGGLPDDLGAVPGGEMTTKDLTAPDGKLPVDLRYMASSTSLELLTEEEERVLRELEQFEFKVCNLISLLFV